MIGGIRSRLVDYEALLAEAPGVEAMEKLFQRLDGILFCIKDREGCYLSANDAFLQRARVEDPCDLIGRTAREFFPPLLAAGYEQQDADVIARGEETRDKAGNDYQPGWWRRLVSLGQDSHSEPARACHWYRQHVQRSPLVVGQ